MKIEQAGLAAKWWKDYGNDPTHCFDKIKKEMKNFDTSSVKHRLSLRDLSGAFLILLVGYVVSITTFIFERLIKPKPRPLRRQSPKPKLANPIKRRNSLDNVVLNAIRRRVNARVPPPPPPQRRKSVHEVRVIGLPIVTEAVIEIH